MKNKNEINKNEIRNINIEISHVEKETMPQINYRAML